MPNPTGHRDSIKNSQFKAVWHSGPTRTIRVPIALAEVTLEYTRQLDQGIEPRDTGELSNNELSVAIIEPHDTGISAGNQVDAVAIEPRDTANIQAELKDARADYAALLESSTVVTKKLKEQVQGLRSQLEAQKTSWDELREELDDREETCAKLQAENSKLEKTCSDLWENLELKQKLAAARKLPEAADLLNQLKAERKKSTASLADVEKILEILEERSNDKY